MSDFHPIALSADEFNRRHPVGTLVYYCNTPARRTSAPAIIKSGRAMVSVEGDDAHLYALSSLKLAPSCLRCNGARKIAPIEHLGRSGLVMQGGWVDCPECARTEAAA